MFTPSFPPTKVTSDHGWLDLGAVPSELFPVILIAPLSLSFVCLRRMHVSAPTAAGRTTAAVAPGPGGNDTWLRHARWSTQAAMPDGAPKPPCQMAHLSRHARWRTQTQYIADTTPPGTVAERNLAATTSTPASCGVPTVNGCMVVSLPLPHSGTAVTLLLFYTVHS